MAQPLRKPEPEDLMEARMARVEARVGHIEQDVAEIKTDMRRLEAKIDSVKDSVAALAVRMERGFASLSEKFDRKLAWVVGLMLTLGLTLAAGCASGFLWLAAKINEL